MILILDYGVGNLLSIKRAYDLFEVNTKISNNNLDFENSSHLVLPGVGSFVEGMNSLKKQNFDNYIKDYVHANKKILGICLGMQLFFSESSEFKKTKGLNLIEGKVKKIPLKENTIPHIGWSKIKKMKEIKSQIKVLEHEISEMEKKTFKGFGK